MSTENLKKIKIIAPYVPKHSKKKVWFADIETIIVGGLHVPVVLCFVSGKKVYKINKEGDFFVEAVETMLSTCKGGIIYFHNFGRFDSMFILKALLLLTSHKPQIVERNNVIYELRIFNDDDEIVMRDSYLILPISLKSIGENFCCDYLKHGFEYDNLKDIYYNNKNEVIELCVNDCKTLEEGFNNFAKLILDNFKIDVNTQLTLPSISFNIFRSIYYNSGENPIAKNPFDIDKYIRKSYMGGLCDVYIPSLENGYCYDVNSLYPAIMKDNKFPIGKPKKVRASDIDIKNFIGFIDCDVISPKYMKVPFLPFNDRERGLITPLGKWSGTYFYKEIIKAQELGYKFIFKSGLKYEREDFLFTEFVDDIYKMRLDNKGLPLDKICKLILNSLYGRFGMQVDKESTKFLTLKELKKMKENYTITSFHTVSDDYYIVNGKKDMRTSKERYKNTIDVLTAVQIASAITSYARIFMYNFKNLENNRCYYSDTDSIFLSKKLDDKFVGGEMGKFKLEYQLEKGFFIAPKMYKIILKDIPEKITMKGIKKDEVKSIDDKLFVNIIKNSDLQTLDIDRVNRFKRDFKNIEIKEEFSSLKFLIPFKKRERVYDLEGNWVDTEPIKINSIVLIDRNL